MTMPGLGLKHKPLFLNIWYLLRNDPLSLPVRDDGFLDFYGILWMQGERNFSYYEDKLPWEEVVEESE